MNKINPLVLTAAVFSLFGCGGNSDNAHNTAQDTTLVVVKDTTPVTVNDTTKFKFDFAIGNIPSPANSMQDVSKWNVAYDNTWFNDTKNISKYTTEYQRAVNLGVYNIDMCYAMVSENGEDVLKYMKNVISLSDALGLKGAVNGMVGKRAENNLSNKDSLFKILDEIFVKSDDYLRTNARVYTASSVFAGSWVESLYLVNEIGAKTGDAAVKAKVNKHIWEQRFHLANLINLLGDYKDKKEAVELINALKPIHEEIQAVKQSTDMDDAKFKSISEKIISLRNKLTN